MGDGLGGHNGRSGPGRQVVERGVHKLRLQGRYPQVAVARLVAGGPALEGVMVTDMIWLIALFIVVAVVVGMWLNGGKGA